MSFRTFSGTRFMVAFLVTTRGGVGGRGESGLFFKNSSPGASHYFYFLV